MSESRWIEKVRGEKREKLHKPTQRAIECPVCGGHTVERDISPADGYYVEVCLGGVIVLAGEVEADDEELDCPYWNTGREE